ncbi:hypothetical protein RE6C_05887 [Rhodopirellula europaea 6C]|uniref:Uncharacterized protein n=1 Tax=Rhodopirellula europaea 6C TaxID=1263867 RepID=M2ATR6_9BACT|nr:hypothetical protein RE6C_05887 [Rhodopirellula europaea 6C]
MPIWELKALKRYCCETTLRTIRLSQADLTDQRGPKFERWFGFWNQHSPSNFLCPIARI